ncbi:MAG: hypothetical protein ACI9SY_000665 [Candidatus Paceibacteria bacterium]|jgi:hypothetical protein
MVAFFVFCILIYTTLTSIWSCAVTNFDLSTLAWFLTIALIVWHVYLKRTSRVRMPRELWFSEQKTMVRGDIFWLLGFAAMAAWIVNLL